MNSVGGNELPTPFSPESSAGFTPCLLTLALICKYTQQSDSLWLKYVWTAVSISLLKPIYKLHHNS